MNKFEQLIDLIINEESEKARELFHQIVVEKSRDIYESLINDEEEETVGGSDVDGLLDDITAEEEGMNEEEEEEFADGEFDADSVTDGDTDVTGEPEGELEDRVLDLEDALDELKAEFDALLADEETEGHDIEAIQSAGDEGGEFGGDFPAGDDDTEEPIREYVEKVKVQDGQGRLVGKDGTVSVSDKSIVAKKNDMGGSTANIAKGGSEGTPDGTKANAGKDNFYKKGRGDLPGANKFKNVPGSSAKLDALGKSYEKSKEGEGRLVGSDGKATIGKRSIEGGK